MRAAPSSATTFESRFRPLANPFCDSCVFWEAIIETAARCTLETIFRLRNNFDPISKKQIGFQAFNVNCYDMNDSIIKNIKNNVPLIEHEVFQQVNMANFTFTPRGHLSVPPVSGKNELVIIIGSRSDSNNVTRGKCIVVSPPIGMISAGHTRNYLSAGSRVMASTGNSTWSKQSCDLS